MLLNIIIHLYHGTPLSSFFKAPTEVLFEGNEYQINISKAAIFTNFLGIKRKLEEIPYGFNVTINLKETKMVDNSVLENLEHFKHDYEANGGKVNVVGLESHQAFSNHPNSSRKKLQYVK